MWVCFFDGRHLQWLRLSDTYNMTKQLQEMGVTCWRVHGESVAVSFQVLEDFCHLWPLQQYPWHVYQKHVGFHPVLYQCLLQCHEELLPWQGNKRRELNRVHLVSYTGVDGVQSISGDSEYKDMVAMLVPRIIIIELKLISILLLKFHQHGCRDVTCKLAWPGEGFWWGH